MRRTSSSHTSLERQIAAARLYSALRWLVALTLFFSLWQGYLWWSTGQPKPVLVSVDCKNTAGGYLVTFTVKNQGAPGEIAMTPQLVGVDGKPVQGVSYPTLRAHFAKDEVLHRRAVITSVTPEKPYGCQVELSPPQRKSG